MCLVSLEGDLQDAVAQPVAIETGNSHGRLIVIRHGDEAKAFALVGVEVTDHLDVVDGTERPKQLPEHTFIGIWRQIVHEDAPTSARVPRDVHPNQTGHAVNGDGGEPERRGRVGQGGGGPERREERKKLILTEQVKANSQIVSESTAHGMTKKIYLCLAFTSLYFFETHYKTESFFQIKICHGAHLLIHYFLQLQCNKKIFTFY